MTITVEVPDTLKAKIDALSSDDGVSLSEWVLDVLERQVFLRRYDELRNTALEELDSRGEKYTDEDIFKIVS